MTMSTITKYAQSKTQDEMGDMQDGVYEDPTGEYIKIADLLKWLDIEILMAEENLRETQKHSGVNVESVARAILGTYKVVKSKLTKQ